MRPSNTGLLPNRVYVLSDEAGVMGGAAKASLLLCEALAKGGARVELFVTTLPEAAVRHRLDAQGIRCHPAPVGRGSRFKIPARSNGFFAWLRILASPSVILHAVGMQREVMQFLSLPGRFETFVWETTEALPDNKFVRPEAARLLKKAKVLLVPSRTVEANARLTYSYSGRSAVLPFWAEDRGRGVVPFPPHEPRSFLFVGRMDEDKGFRYLVPAFAEARTRRGNITLDVCGSGDPKRIPELARATEGVFARGSIPDADLDRKLSDCFAFVLASLHEGYPLTLLEACSYGKPVIATTVGSIPEVFANRACAILVPPGDSEALLEAMEKLLDEPDEAYLERAADARRLFDEVSSDAAVRAALARAYRTDVTAENPS